MPIIQIFVDVINTGAGITFNLHREESLVPRGILAVRWHCVAMHYVHHYVHL